MILLYDIIDIKGNIQTFDNMFLQHSFISPKIQLPYFVSLETHRCPLEFIQFCGCEHRLAA